MSYSQQVELTVYRVTVNCASLVIKVLPWVWISKSQTKISDLCNIWINSVNNSTTWVAQEPFFTSEEHIYFFSPVLWSVSRTHFWHHAGMVEVAGQEGTYSWESFCVRNESSILEQCLCLGYIFTDTSVSSFTRKKSRFSFSHIPACSLLNKQRSEDGTVQFSCELRTQVSHTFLECHHSSLPFPL